jgi:hypothetical protein
MKNEELENVKFLIPHSSFPISESLGVYLFVVGQERG